MTRYIIDPKTGRPVLSDDKSETGQASPPSTFLDVLNKQTPATAINLPIPTNLQNAVITITSPEYVNACTAQGIQAHEAIDGLAETFQELDIPIGLVSKVTHMKGDAFHFVVDDSTSMDGESNLHCSEASRHMPVNVKNRGDMLSRWEEAEDRLHRLVDLLAHIPTGPIIISRFDHPHSNGSVTEGQRVIFDRKNNKQSIADFKKDAHAQINLLFQKDPEGSTPLLFNLQRMGAEARELSDEKEYRTRRILLSDGEPNGGGREKEMIRLYLKSVEQRGDFQNNPVTFCPCSNDEEDTEYMHELEEDADFVAAVADYKHELAEILEFQGPGFKYSRGMWCLCQLVAATNPNDLDAMNQCEPLTKHTYENLKGHLMSSDEYRSYFNRTKYGSHFTRDYAQFETTELACQIDCVQVFTKAFRSLLDFAISHTEEDKNRKAERERQAMNHAINTLDNYFRSRNPANYAGTTFAAARVVANSQPSSGQSSSYSNNESNKKGACCLIQ